ncbi:sensor histidine kinase [Actomonas aquatica]|uniref:Histidine kinase n=1 Tax=Actomonas aquatica TaxID=2866162 RepID=A0ABZ1CD67_9BACT|nr:histidine kinase [Opitutus sp. WL0086]WRQ89605.1 histidine kinase [Opitutus sp. WL0086]
MTHFCNLDQTSSPVAARPHLAPQLPWGLVALLAGVSIMSGLAFTWPLLRFIELDAAMAATLVLLGWGPWALLAGGIIAFARLAPLDPHRWRRTLPLHIAACSLLALGSYLFSDWMRDRHFHQGGGFGPTGPAPREMVLNQPPPPPPDSGSGPGTLPAPDATTLASMMLSRSFGSGLVVPVYLLLVAVTQAMRNHRRADETARLAERAAHQLAQARLQALQNQLQPHFLFNTLNAVTNYIHTQPQVAEEMVCALSDLLRRVLKLSDRTSIPLREELEIADLYLAVQRHRFAGRLVLVRHIDPRLLDRPVPPLLLQPVIENAIVHGVAHATEAKPIELRVEEVNRHLRFSLIDHHPVPAPRLDPSRTGGVGLSNIRSRLATLYGGHAGLHAEPRLEGGFLTEINLPLHLPALSS